MTQPYLNQDNRNVVKGLLLLITGVLLLLYTLNLITTGINALLILASIGLIVYGSVTSGLDQLGKRLYDSIRNRNK
jgi:hypothetical protein